MEYVAGFVMFIGLAICGAGGVAIAMMIVAGILDYAARYMWRNAKEAYSVGYLRRTAKIIHRRQMIKEGRK
ncbi:hypothetical protein [Serratia ficaria]|uniref:hypothetical protein n=1 Tax=Serratia ficaria TaxID=61651 RepID=UPI00119A715B|nr:hypothetical protein [Serratia ficaria]CAI1019209.1 Uncharacterised protein [Serratia ficaria]CAI1974899.1 Uncharacterised protein [Serratia ficaria]VVA47962.1 hypothetical protein SERVES_01683 [Serratia ficaria]